MYLDKLNGGLSLGILPSYNPQDVPFQAPALLFHHANQRKGEQGVLLNQPD